MKTLNALAPVIVVACLAVPAVAQTTTTTAPPAAAPSAAVPAADVLGTWDATITTQQGQVIPSQLTLKKDGEKIVGTISSDMGAAPVEAEVKGKALALWFTFQGQSGPMAVELAGTVDGDAVKGSMTVGGQGGGEWTATRAKEGKDSKDLPKESKDPAPPAPPAPSSPSTPSLTGTWNVTVELPNMTANPTVVLKQDGEKLAGDYVSAQYGKFQVTGTIKGADVSFWFEMNVEGTGLNVTYTGTLDKDGGLKGSVNYGDMMSGTFVASKKK
jgi:hypothetical protein